MHNSMVKLAAKNI